MTQPVRKLYQIPFRPRGDSHWHRGLGRHVNHDPRSRRYAFPASLAQLTAVFHERRIPIFDQGSLGSCTGNAGLGTMATGPYWDGLTPLQRQGGLAGGRYAWNEDGAVQLYSDATADDGFDGQYPPDDTGSDGLTIGKELVKHGIIPGYQHTFSLNAALAALMQFPLLVGTRWLDEMFSPDSYGRIKALGPVVGGHEWIVDEFVPAGAASHAGDVLGSVPYVGATNSWGSGFGAQGRFYLKVSDFGGLLSADGDVMVLTPPTAPAPAPAPAPSDTDARLAAAMRAWLAEHPGV